MQQRPFEWHERDDEVPVVEMMLEPETITRVITQMATALIAVVRDAASLKEAGDDQ